MSTPGFANYKGWESNLQIKTIHGCDSIWSLKCVYNPLITRNNCVSSTARSSFFTLFFTFSIDLNFSWADMLCSSPATGTVLNSSGSNTSHAQPINHQRAQQTNHLLMKQGSHEFLTAIVLFIKPDQTMRIQTSFKKETCGGITYSSADSYWWWKKKTGALETQRETEQWEEEFRVMLWQQDACLN